MGTLSYILWYFLYFIPLGLVVPQMGSFVYNYLELNPGVLFLTSQLAMPIGALLAGWLFDKTGYFRRILFILIGVMGFSLNLLLHEVPHWASWLLFALFYIAGGGVHPLLSSAYLKTGLPERGFALARGFGTFSFLLVNALLSFSSRESGLIIEFAAIGFLIVWPLTYFLPPVREKKKTAGKKRQLLLLRKLFSSHHFMAFFFLMVLYNFQFVSAETVLSEYLNQKKLTLVGKPLQVLPLSWTVATLVETVFFFVLSLYRGKYPALGLLGLAFLAGILRYAFLLVTKDALVIVAVQGLHGIHFGAAYLGSVFYVREKSPSLLLATATAASQLLARAIGGGFAGLLFGELALLSWQLVFWLNFISAMAGFLYLYVFYRFFGKRSSF